ncbi:MAG: hypothetical protein DWQ36_12230 [Acidobacteria bacterium]|nr:MAG: hypothetical protein DWQ30_13405 [Acidobacteriota bacterium]REK07310.1 MAG: hypothetical protein DWQ36_12230 [Acidobacteriota bacterium]
MRIRFVPFAHAVALVGALTFTVALGASSARAQRPSVEVEQIACLLVEENTVVRASVSGDVPASEVRLYFRRLHEEVEDFYYVSMRPSGSGDYWGVLPKPRDEVLERRELDDVQESVRELWALWWREKIAQSDRNPNDDLNQSIIEERASIGDDEARDWMQALDDRALEAWLEELEYEPAEYYAAVYDAFGRRLARSGMRISQVRDQCPVRLDPIEASLAQNLTIGETAAWQRGEEVFHWLCDGVVTRIGFDGIYRADDVCRACVVAWWQMPAVLVPSAAGATATGVLFVDDDVPPASPDRP